MNSETGSENAFHLETFFPYQVRIFYTAVSQAVSDIYSRRHGLSVAEWRTLSVLGNHAYHQAPLTASDVVQRSSIDKVQVSRAIQALLKRGLLERRTDAGDRRRVNLQLNTEGQRVFADLIPRVRALEQELLSALAPEEQRTLTALMARVRARAEAINRASAQTHDSQPEVMP